MERIVAAVRIKLERGGIHCIRGYDGRQLPQLDAPMAAVTIADAKYFPISSDGTVSKDADYAAYGLGVEAQLRIDVYDDYRHGDQACVDTAISAATICASLPGEFTCGKIQLDSVHYTPDLDCFCCSLKIPVRLFIVRREWIVGR